MILASLNKSYDRSQDMLPATEWFDAIEAEGGYVINTEPSQLFKRHNRDLLRSLGTEATKFLVSRNEYSDSQNLFVTALKKRDEVHSGVELIVPVFYDLFPKKFGRQLMYFPKLQVSTNNNNQSGIRFIDPR